MVTFRCYVTSSRYGGDEHDHGFSPGTGSSPGSGLRNRKARRLPAGPARRPPTARPAPWADVRPHHVAASHRCASRARSRAAGARARSSWSWPFAHAACLRSRGCGRGGGLSRGGRRTRPPGDGWALDRRRHRQCLRRHLPDPGVVNVDQPLDTSFLRLLQANREVITGPGFSQLWPAILASMRIDVLPETAHRLLSTELPRQDVVLSYWHQGLELPPADMETRVAEGLAALRRQQIPYLIIAGHQWDDAE